MRFPASTHDARPVGRIVRRRVVAFAMGALVAALPSVAPAAAPEPLRVGLLTVKTGPLAGPGKQMEDGLRFFLKERGNQLAGRPVELIVADTAGQPATARTKAQELVERSKVALLVGPLATTELLAIDDYVRDAKVPTIVSSALAEDITQRTPNAWMVRASATTGQIMHPLGAYAAGTLGYKRVATVATDFSFGHEAVGSFQRTFEDGGGKVVQKIWVPPTATDFAAYVAQIKPNVDAVFASFSGSSATGFVRQYADYGLKAKIPLIASHSTVEESLLKAEGENAVGIISAGIYSAAIDTPENNAFDRAFRTATGTDPGFYSVGTYMAGLFLEAALKATAGHTDDPAALMRALRSLKLAHSPRGPISIDEYGNPVGSTYIRRTERKNGRLQNTVIHVYPETTQFWTYDPKRFLADPVYSRDYPPTRFIER
ncbi:MAG: ABC transporter substrate-binding protein [Pigmentiphaga sp.]|uniref:ABC transporter substrate-binding protein n=1 Tax=Pigmentiphaga sp. TaxID=1977564 RepID=UPI003B559FD3